jgi:hypothetical protein
LMKHFLWWCHHPGGGPHCFGNSMWVWLQIEYTKQKKL